MTTLPHAAEYTDAHGAPHVPDWVSIAATPPLTIPHKGTRIRIPRHFIAHLAALAGMQMKTGAVEVPETIGVMEHVYGVGPRPGVFDAVEFHVRTDDGELRVVTLAHTAESLARVQVEAPRG